VQVLCAGGAHFLCRARLRDLSASSYRHPWARRLHLPGFSLAGRLPARSTLFPYTTLFRSVVELHRLVRDADRQNLHLPVHLHGRSEEHTSELQSANISYAVFCLKKKTISFI